MKIDSEQFEELIKTIGTEPSLNFYSGSLWVAVASTLVAWGLFKLARKEYQRSQLEVDSSLILGSFKEYDALYDSLNAIRNLSKVHKTYLDKLTLSKFDDAMFELVKSNEIDRGEWKSARSTKTFYKARFELVDKGFFSSKAIAISIDRWGADLVRDELYKLDVYIFYQLRLDDFRTGNYSEEDMVSTFAGDLNWYAEFPKFMKAQNSKFGWRDLGKKKQA